MQELEKILEEIDDCICEWLSTPTDKFDQGYIKGLRRAKKIIYKNMNEKDINTAGELISRQALLDDFRNTITENSDTFDWLNMIARQRTIKQGADWIPAEERWPTKEECENDYFWIMLQYNTRPIIAKCEWIESEDDNGNDDSFSEFFIDRYPQIYTPSKDIIISWKIADIPEPYIQRKQNKPEDHYPEWRAKLLSKFDRRE